MWCDQSHNWRWFSRRALGATRIFRGHFLFTGLYFSQKSEIWEGCTLGEQASFWDTAAAGSLSRKYLEQCENFTNRKTENVFYTVPYVMERLHWIIFRIRSKIDGCLYYILNVSFLVTVRHPDKSTGTFIVVFFCGQPVKLIQTEATCAVTYSLKSLESFFSLRRKTIILIDGCLYYILNVSFLVTVRHPDKSTGTFIVVFFCGQPVKLIQTEATCAVTYSLKSLESFFSLRRKTIILIDGCLYYILNVSFLVTVRHPDKSTGTFIVVFFCGQPVKLIQTEATCAVTYSLKSLESFFSLRRKTIILIFEVDYDSQYH